MATRIFVDTSFVLALINTRDQYHEQARARSHQFEISELITTEAVLLEIGNAMAKNFRREAVAVIRILQSSPTIEVVPTGGELIEKGLAMYEKYQDKTWGLVDCISFVAMQENGIEAALTFDADFSQAGFRIIGS